MWKVRLPANLDFTEPLTGSKEIRKQDFYRPQRSCEGYVFTGVCLSTGRGVVSQHALQVISQHALQQVSREVRGGGIPACLAGGIPACLAAGLRGGGGGGIPACLAAGLRGGGGGGIPACLAAGLWGGVPAPRGVPATRGVPAPGGGACSGGVEETPRAADGYCYGRYAFYWNAFLCNLIAF